MTPEERDMIQDLFGRIGGAPTETNDREAERLISEAVARNPNAPYVLVQTVLLQEEALRRADERIRQLQGAGAQGAGRGTSSFLAAGRRGGDAVPSGGSVPSAGVQARAPASLRARSEQPVQGAGVGGFLSSALATAGGVMGGMFLADSIRDLFGGSATDSKSAAAESKPSPAEQPAQDATHDDKQEAEEDYQLADYDEEDDAGWDDDDSIDV